MSSTVGFQYSILHYRHDITTGEVINIGMAFYCPNTNYFRGKTITLFKRVLDIFPDTDAHFLRKYTNLINSRIRKISKEFEAKQPKIPNSYENELRNLLPRVLIPDDSSIFYGEIKFGLAPIQDIEKIFGQLYYSIIEKYNSKKDKNSRTNEEVWKYYRKPLKKMSIASYLTKQKIVTINDELHFDYGWKNGKINILNPMSFDLQDTTSMRKKTNEILGTIFSVNLTNQVNNFYLLLGEPTHHNGDHKKVYEQSKDKIFRYTKSESSSTNTIIVEENEVDDFAREVGQKIIKDLNLTEKAL